MTCPICDGGRGGLCDDCHRSLDRSLPAGDRCVAGYTFYDYISWAARRSHRMTKKRAKENPHV